MEFNDHKDDEFMDAKKKGDKIGGNNCKKVELRTLDAYIVIHPFP